jgi:hypothetical protein
MSDITTLVQLVSNEINEVPEAAIILRYIPRFAAAVNTMTIPGAEKKAHVLTALHDVVRMLDELKKLTPELRKDLDLIIDTVAPITIDTVIDVSSGKITFDKPATVVEASTKCFCSLLPLLALIPKAKAQEVKAQEVKAEVEAKVEAKEVELKEVIKEVKEEIKEVQAV